MIMAPFEKMIELKELTECTCNIFQVDNVGDLGNALMNCIEENNVDTYQKFTDLVQDLSIDWLQKIFQYYQADRKEKMQDYTPKTLALLMGTLVGNADTVIDMCAGSGALTIQKWNLNNDTRFELYEFDENVIPYLLFNMAIRNIECKVYQSDVLQDEIFNTWRIRKGEQFGIVEVIQ